MTTPSFVVSQITSATQTQIIDCPKQLVGKIIGRGGETISQIQNKTGCKLQIDQNVPEGSPCKVTIQGNPQVRSYQAIISFLMYLLTSTHACIYSYSYVLFLSRHMHTYTFQIVYTRTHICICCHSCFCRG